MERSELEILAEKYLNGTATPEEKDQLHQWFDTVEDSEFEVVPTTEVVSTAEFGNEMLANLRRRIADEHVKKPVRTINFSVWKVAAAFVLVLGAAYFSIKQFQKESSNPVAILPASPVQNDALPGTNKAILTLSGGSTILLDSAADGLLYQQGNVEVLKTSDGQLSYKPLDAHTQVMEWNTLTIPRGGYYQLALSDGSQVWLNSGSSITYPVAFSGPDRIVKISGEVYFEVNRNEKKKFKVIVSRNDMEIEVLGTHFNVNAYNDESAVTTSLLEGSVRITNGDRKALLKPGQQSRLYADNKLIVSAGDVEQSIAWKNGYFHFDGAGIKDIMRQLSRWYDIDITYRDSIPVREFEGQIPRNALLSEVLQMLAVSNVKFRVEGKNLIIGK